MHAGSHQGTRDPNADGKRETKAPSEPGSREPFVSRHERFQLGQQPPLCFRTSNFPFSLARAFYPAPPVGWHANYLMVVIPSAGKAGSRAVPVVQTRGLPLPAPPRETERQRVVPRTLLRGLTQLHRVKQKPRT